MKYLILITILVFYFANLKAQEGDLTPKYSNEFLSIGIGARSMGMGNSVISSTHDQTSAYWNPTGILEIENDMQIGAMHNEYFAGIAKFDYLGGAVKLSDSTSMGFSIFRFGVDDIPNTLDLVDSEGNIDYDRIKSFSVADYAFIFSFAKKTNIKGLSLGGNAKIIRRNVGEFAGAWGFGLDVSAKYFWKDFTFGGTFRDVTTTFNAWSFNTETFEDAFIKTGNEIPENSIELTMPKLLLGASRRFVIKEDFGLMPELALDISFDGKRNVLLKGDPVSVDPHIGFEADYKKLVFLRLGTYNIQEVPNIDNENEFTFQPSLGLGLRLWRLRLDYAFSDVGDQSIALYSHVFSLSYALDKKAL